MEIVRGDDRSCVHLNYSLVDGEKGKWVFYGTKDYTNSLYDVFKPLVDSGELYQIKLKRVIGGVYAFLVYSDYSKKNDVRETIDAFLINVHPFWVSNNFTRVKSRAKRKLGGLVKRLL